MIIKQQCGVSRVGVIAVLGSLLLDRQERLDHAGSSWLHVGSREKRTLIIRSAVRTCRQVQDRVRLRREASKKRTGRDRREQIGGAGHFLYLTIHDTHHLPFPKLQRASGWPVNTHVST